MHETSAEVAGVRLADAIAVIGGGRWARVIISVLCQIVPRPVKITVHSRRNAEGMADWVSKRDLRERVSVSAEWPELRSLKTRAVIVANAARDHERAVEWALGSGVPVLVEKPIGLTAGGAQRLADLASERNVPLAVAHVFLFARYLECFARLSGEAGGPDALEICWRDPGREERYGESKRYDASLPVFADWLPHVVPIVNALLSRLPGTCEVLQIGRGGAAVELKLMAGRTPCIIRMERNADRRQRIVQASSEGGSMQLDFSLEPGTISRGSWTATSDEYWNARERPLARMLLAFLDWVAGGEADGRLSVGPALRACEIIDQTQEKYRSALLPWLIARLGERASVDEDLRYALAEVLQVEGNLPSGELDRRICSVTTRLSGSDAGRWLGELTHARDPGKLLRTLAA